MSIVGDRTVLECKFCDKAAMVADLVLMNGTSFPKAGSHGCLPSYYHRFCFCDTGKKRALAFFDGEELRLNEAFARLVKEVPALHVLGKVELLVDYQKTIKELKVQGKFNSVGLDVTDDNFPPEIWEKDLGKMPRKFKVFRCEKPMEFEEVAVALHQEKCRGASLREGLAFGIEKPHVHKRLSLILPGSFWRNSATAYRIRQVPELSSISNTRHVYLHQLDLAHPAGMCFLAVAL